MSLDFVFGQSGIISLEDTYAAATPQKVVLKRSFSGNSVAKQKSISITGLLSGPLQFHVNSHWQSLLNGANGAVGSIASSILSGADTIAQTVAGRSIRQPWFGRKTWQGTDPLSFVVPMEFVAYVDAKTEVYDPMVGLMSLLYPRASNEAYSEDTTALLSTYFIPGPTLFYPSELIKNNTGDTISVTVGSLISFSACYVEGLTITVYNSFTPDGYPQRISCTVSVTSMDTPFVNQDGTFMNSTGITNQSVVVNKAITSAISKAISLIKSL
jgi:hypothetical protein